MSGVDLTAEAALAKLFYLIGVSHDPDRVRELMQRGANSGVFHLETR